MSKRLKKLKSQKKNKTGAKKKQNKKIEEIV